MSEKTEVREVKESVKEMSDKIIHGLNYESEGAIFRADKDVFKSCIPDGLSEKVIKSVNDFQTDFVAAGALAFGKAAIDKLKEDKSLDAVHGEIPMQGRNSAEYSMQRSKTYNNQLGGGEQVEKFGVLKPFYNVKTGKNVGDLAIIKKQLNEMAAKALK